MKRKAIIWDMDGVISNTQDIHAEVESQLLAEHGITLSAQEITKKYAGRKTDEFFREVCDERNKSPSLAEELVAQKWKMAIQRVKEAKPIPGALELIKEAKKNNIPQAVASSAIKAYVMEVLTKLGVEKQFKAIVSGDEVSKGKPDPEIFLKAASLLNVHPSTCVVIEDGVSGMIGAKNAGMKCIGLVPHSRDCPADVKTDSLTKLSLNDLLNL